MQTKTCRQCGELKPIEQFRSYYGGRKGTYTICKSCEKINSRAKYLEKKSAITEPERSELNKIYTLYDAQQACGLQPPRRGTGRHTELADNLDEMIGRYSAKAMELSVDAGILEVDNIPIELRTWLTTALTKEPDYYLDEVYEALKAKYRPMLRVNTDTMMPEYDDTYKAVLEAILGRFNDYEDGYYDEV